MYQKYNDSSSGDRPEFNMALMVLKGIDLRLEDVDQASINGELLKWYRANWRIYLRISYKLNDKEKDIVKKKLKDITQAMGSAKVPSHSSERVMVKAANDVINKVETLLQDLDEYLYELMYAYNILFPKKVKKTLEEQMEEDYTEGM